MADEKESKPSGEITTNAITDVTQLASQVEFLSDQKMLHDLREMGWTQANLSKQITCDHQAISKVLAGKRKCLPAKYQPALRQIYQKELADKISGFVADSPLPQNFSPTSVSESGANGSSSEIRPPEGLRDKASSPPDSSSRTLAFEVFLEDPRKLRPNPLNEELFNRPDPATWAAMKKDIDQYGVREAIEISHDGQIISGHLRCEAELEIAHEEAREPRRVPVRVVELDSEETEEWLISANILRRELSPASIARCVKQLVERYSGRRGRPKKNAVAAIISGSTNKIVGEKLGLSERQVAVYFQVSKASKDVLNSLDDGTLLLSEAEKVTRLEGIQLQSFHQLLETSPDRSQVRDFFDGLQERQPFTSTDEEEVAVSNLLNQHAEIIGECNTLESENSSQVSQFSDTLSVTGDVGRIVNSLRKLRRILEDLPHPEQILEADKKQQIRQELTNISKIVDVWKDNLADGK